MQKSRFSYSSLNTDDSEYNLISGPFVPPPQKLCSSWLKIFPVVIFIVTIILYFWQVKMDTTVVATITNTGTINKQYFRVVLFGDSLINVPCIKFGLQAQIKYRVECYYYMCTMRMYTPTVYCVIISI